MFLSYLALSIAGGFVSYGLGYIKGVARGVQETMERMTQIMGAAKQGMGMLKGAMPDLSLKGIIGMALPSLLNKFLGGMGGAGGAPPNT